MVLADYVAIGLVVLTGTLGAAIGFGKGLKFLTSGVVGILISAVSCYFLFSLALSFSFVQSLTSKIADYFTSLDNGLGRFLSTIRIETISVAVVLFILVQVSRKIIVLIIAKALETNNVAVKVINKTAGAVLGIAVLVALSLIVMQITYMSGINEPSRLAGSFFRLDYVYLNNPLTSLIKL